MARTSAKSGKITFAGVEVPNVTNIEVERDGGVQRHSTSSTGGEFARNSGATDIRGSFTMMELERPAAIEEGAEATLVVELEDGTVEYTGLAFIESVRARAPVDGGANITWDVTWGRTQANP